jgi:signal transduction histidine kinase
MNNHHNLLIAKVVSKGMNHDLPKPLTYIYDDFSNLKDEFSNHSILSIRLTEIVDLVNNNSSVLETILEEISSLDPSNSGKVTVASIIKENLVPAYEKYKLLVNQSKQEFVDAVIPSLESDVIENMTSITRNLTRFERMLHGLVQLIEPSDEGGWRETDLVRQSRRVFNDILNNSEYSSIEITALGDGVVTVMAKWTDLQSILFNLLENAARYAAIAEKPKITLTQRVFKYTSISERFALSEKYEGAGAWIALTIANSIPKSLNVPLHKIYDLYFTTEKVGHLRSGGTGIGLSVVKLLTHSNGAMIVSDLGYDLKWSLLDDREEIVTTGTRSIYLNKIGQYIFVRVFFGKNEPFFDFNEEYHKYSDEFPEIRELMELYWNMRTMPSKIRMKVLYLLHRLLISDQDFKARPLSFRTHLLWPRGRNDAVDYYTLMEQEYDLDFGASL